MTWLQMGNYFFVSVVTSDFMIVEPSYTPPQKDVGSGVISYSDEKYSMYIIKIIIFQFFFQIVTHAFQKDFDKSWHWKWQRVNKALVIIWIPTVPHKP